MTDFSRQDLGGSRFEDVDLKGSEFRKVDLSDAQFRDVYLHGVRMRGVELAHVDINGEILDVTINGVEIAPLVTAELDRRYPDRAKMRPTDAAGFREAWDVVERLWGETVDRARRLDPALLNESVDDEWSFIQTLRHLVFATDAWIRRCDPRRPVAVARPGPAVGGGAGVAEYPAGPRRTTVARRGARAAPRPDVHRA